MLRHVPNADGETCTLCWGMYLMLTERGAPNGTYRFVGNNPFHYKPHCHSWHDHFQDEFVSLPHVRSFFRCAEIWATGRGQIPTVNICQSRDAPPPSWSKNCWKNFLAGISFRFLYRRSCKKQNSTCIPPGWPCLIWQLLRLIFLQVVPSCSSMRWL